MNFNVPAAVPHQGEIRDPIAEVLDTEKHLLALINSKGLLDKDVQELYRKACADFENIMLDSHQVVKLQEVEYLLWKLHYFHIEEFRRRIRQLTANAKDKKTKSVHDESNYLADIDKHMEGLRSFLSEATAFYETLIRKLRSRCGFPGDLLSRGKTDRSFSTEPTKFNAVQYICHRFLICLGDIARYKEFCKKSDARNWSVAAIFYLEAARLWPDSGNPHNQLALLGTYVGDSFLALYHCLRSLAVKEPFPDVWRNLMLLIEENRSSHLPLSSMAHIDFSRPHERILIKCASVGSNHLANNKSEGTGKVSSSKTDLWSLIVRVISFFIVRASMKDFSLTLASAVRELEALVLLNDEELHTALVSYQHVHSSRGGPHRAIQLVAVFIFVVDSLIGNLKREKDEKQQFSLIQLALATTFLCIGRLTERCLKSKDLEVCPLLPSVLTFLEWLVSILDKVEEHTADENVSSTMSYFFGILADLLNQLAEGEREVSSESALWEDHELRGFKPMAYAHAPLDFRSNQERIEDFKCGYIDRCIRILSAAKQILGISNAWISYDQKERKYCMVESVTLKGEKVVEGATSNFTAEGRGEQNSRCGNEVDRKGLSITTEEEEVILFKPITRHNSAPLYPIGKSDLNSKENAEEQGTSSDERLRRATSLVDEKNQKQEDSFSFHTDTISARGIKPFKQQDHLFKDSTTCAVGPPSLSAWVLNPESPKTDREKGSRNLQKRELSPIREIASESLADLTINETKDPIPASAHVPSSTYNHRPAYVAPVPSAPFLPDDAVCFAGSSSSQEPNQPISSQNGDGILGAPPVSGYPNFSATRGPVDFSHRISGMVDGYPPMMSSSEWLYRYRNNNNLERAPHHALPVHLNSPGLLGNLNTNDASRIGLFDQWGNYLVSDPLLYLESPQVLPAPLIYGADIQIGDTLLPGYQRSSPYVFGAGTTIRAEQPPLLQYLKEKEWKLQRESQLGGPTFLGK